MEARGQRELDARQQLSVHRLTFLSIPLASTVRRPASSGPMPARPTPARVVRSRRSSVPPRHSRCATRPVQPVWCEAPIPAPVSPWKYSWNSSRSRHSGSSRSFVVGAGHRPTAVRVGQPDGHQPAGEVLGHVAQPQAVARSRSGTRRVNVVAQALVPAQQRLDEQVVDREPDRPAPVRVAAEQACSSTRPARSRSTPSRPRWSMLERLVAVPPRQRPQAVRRQEPVLRQRPRAAPARGAPAAARLRMQRSPPGAPARCEPRAANLRLGHARRSEEAREPLAQRLPSSAAWRGHRDRRQDRQQADHRVDLERDRGAVGRRRAS